MKKQSLDKVKEKWRRAYKEALAVRERALANRSRFKVGAVVEDEKGDFHAGCNVENASYRLTTCAEQTAIVKMISAGRRQINFICIVLKGGNKEGGSPCGACRQTIWEFCQGNKKVPVLIGDLKGNLRLASIGELLPDAFAL